MTPDRRAGRPAPAGPGTGTPSAAIMLRIRRIAAQARAIPGFRSPRRGQRSPPSDVRPGGAALAWLASYSTAGVPLPDEFDRLVRRHLDGLLGFGDGARRGQSQAMSDYISCGVVYLTAFLLFPVGFNGEFAVLPSGTSPADKASRLVIGQT